MVHFLILQVAVELTIPHSAVDTEVVALSRQNLSTWREDDDNGLSVSDATPDTVTLRIEHFTGFKISDSRDGGRSLNRGCRSRIPVRVSKLTSHYIMYLVSNIT